MDKEAILLVGAGTGISLGGRATELRSRVWGHRIRGLARSDAVSRSERLHRNFRNGAGIDRPVNIPEIL
jgi:hypothetical protein